MEVFKKQCEHIFTVALAELNLVLCGVGCGGLGLGSTPRTQGEGFLARCNTYQPLESRLPFPLWGE